MSKCNVLRKFVAGFSGFIATVASDTSCGASCHTSETWGIAAKSRKDLFWDLIGDSSSSARIRPVASVE
jgi:hypothetical protein